MSRDWKPLMQKVWSSIDSWKGEHVCLWQPAPAPDRGTRNGEWGAGEGHTYTPLRHIALLSACTRGVRSWSLCGASWIVFCSLQETVCDALIEMGLVCPLNSRLFGAGKSEFTTEKQHQADLWPNTALQLSSSCTGSNQPSSPDHQKPLGPGVPGLMKILESPKRNEVKGESDIPPCTTQKQNWVCEPQQTHVSKVCWAKVLWCSGWDWVEGAASSPHRERPAAAAHPTPSHNTIRFRLKKSRWGIQHFILILCPGVGFKEQKKD